MGRKSKEEINFELRKQTIYQAISDGHYSSKLYEEDKLFVVLLMAGYSAAMAYRCAYRASTASMQSSAVLASRKIREPVIQSLLARVIDCANSGLLYVSQKGFKGKPRWTKWMGKKVKNIDTSPI